MNTPNVPRIPPIAREIMAAKLVTVRPETHVAEAIHLLLKNGISGMPVVDSEGKYLGVFSEKCCMKVLTETAERISRPDVKYPKAREFMAQKLLRLRPEQDVFDAIGQLLKNRVSGAPVCDVSDEFIGTFSEKTSMSVLMEGAYEGLPSAEVGRFMDVDRGRLMSADADLLTIARVFIETPYRRLPIVEGKSVIGQISRRDVLRSSQILDTIIRYQVAAVGDRASMESEDRAFVEAHNQLPSTSVAAFMDTTADTIDEERDLLGIAALFMHSPYRRLPVVREDRAVGQVSRRDVLSALFRQVEPPPSASESGILYLSAIRDRSEMPSV